MTGKAPENAPSKLSCYVDIATGDAPTEAKFAHGYTRCLGDRCLSLSCVEVYRQASIQDVQLHLLVVIIGRPAGVAADIGRWLDKFTSLGLQQLRIFSAIILRYSGKAMPKALRN